MAGEIVRGFVPFGEFKPDLRLIGNDGLVRADNVIPVYGDYITSPALTEISGAIGFGGGLDDIATGLHVHRRNGNGYIGLVYDTGPPLQSKIIEVTEAGVATDRSRAGDYPVLSWTGASFGPHVVMCGGYGIPGTGVETQYQASGAGAFANMITSTFAPRGRFAFPLGPNLFLANCYVPGAYDTLANADYPTLVAWSRNDDLRSFGSPGTNPEILGAGYNDLQFDLGEITGAISVADQGLITFQTGLVVIDGPPYTFSVVSRSFGTIFPYSLCTSDSDVYMYTQAGPARLRGGTMEILGQGRFLRSMIDNIAGSYDHPIASVLGVDPTQGVGVGVHLSMAHDPTNDLLFMCYTKNAESMPKALFVYNIAEDRLSFFRLGTGGEPRQVRFLRSGRQAEQPYWCPGRDLRFVSVKNDVFMGPTHYCRMALGNSSFPAILQGGYISPKVGRATRFKKLRPVYSVTDQAAIEQVSVSIDSTNKPYLTPTTYGSYTVSDTHGWIHTPTTVFADYHSPKFTIAAHAAMHKQIEYQGFEYEAEVGGVYAA